LPSKEQIGRLVKRSSTNSTGYTEIHRRLATGKEDIKLRLSISNQAKDPQNATLSGSYKQWLEESLESVYIPVKEMLSNAPGFRSLYNLRNIHFEEVYADILDRAFLDPLKDPLDMDRKKLLEILQKAMGGKITRDHEEFFLRNKQGKLEFTLLAEGLRKLGLLWLLIQNGTLADNAKLFWDEPESNLNPKLMQTVVEIMLKLQRQGVQIFLSTHEYIILKEFFDLKLQYLCL
jgi:hypothetical protein